MWLAWGVAFLVLEALALWNGVPDDTLTATTVHYAPAAAVGAFIAWLAIHFWRAYRDHDGQMH
jgi:hypothetical protein